MISTPRLQLIPCEVEHLRAFVRAPGELERLLGVRAAQDWLQFPEIIEYSIEQLTTKPEIASWWMYFFILPQDNALIGNGGFKGAADADGTVEIGYAVAPAYQGRNLATEAAQNLVDWAFSHSHITNVTAHTLAETNASTKVLTKIGMRKVAEKFDPDDGEVWQWRIAREDYERRQQG